MTNGIDIIVANHQGILVSIIRGLILFSKWLKHASPIDWLIGKDLDSKNYKNLSNGHWYLKPSNSHLAFFKGNGISSINILT